MRILVTSLYFYPDRTGVPKYSWEMAQWLAARGHEVQVLAGIPHYPEFKRPAGYPAWRYLKEQRQGVTIHRVPHYLPNGVPGTLQRMLIDLSFLLSGLYRLIRLRSAPGRFDVTIAICPSLFDCVLALVHRWLTGKPWTFYIQDFQIDAASQMQMLRRSLVVRLLYRLEAYLLRKADLVVSITPAMCRLAEAKGAAPANSLLVPNWCDIDALAPGASDNEFRRELGLAPQDVVVMYAGAMGPKQDLGLIVKAAAALRVNPSIKFVLIGGGPDWLRLQDECRAQLLGNVIFAPLQPEERLNAMLNAADIHLVVQIPQITDIVMPSKLANIFAVGRCAIVTAASGTALADAVITNQSGLAVTPGSVDELRRAIETLAASPELRRQMGASGRRYAESHLQKSTALGVLEQRLLALQRSVPGAN